MITSDDEVYVFTVRLIHWMVSFFMYAKRTEWICLLLVEVCTIFLYIKAISDISALNCVNEHDNDERGRYDLEGGAAGKHSNYDEGDHCGYLPERSRCSGTAAAPAFPSDTKLSPHQTRSRLLRQVIHWLSATGGHPPRQLAADRELLTITPHPTLCHIA